MVCKPLAPLKSTSVTELHALNALAAIFTTLASITIFVAVPQQICVPTEHVVELVYVYTFDVVYEAATTTAEESLVEWHEISTSPTAGFGARFVLNVNFVVPVLIVAPVVIVIVFPVVPEAVAAAPEFAGLTTSVEAAFVAKTCSSYVQVIVSPAASEVVMPRVRTRDSGVAPAARGLGTVVPRVSVGGHVNMNGLVAPEVAVAQFTPLKSTVAAVIKLVL